MLQNTFHHIPGIGAASEIKLWHAGLLDWDEFCRHGRELVSAKKFSAMSDHLEISREKLCQRHPRYFEQLLPASLHWRFFPEFRDRIAYLDIETNGLDGFHAMITAIALYDGQQVRTYVQGQNLDDFVDDIQDFDVLVTYNGKCFDVPMLENYFRIQLDHAHIDLRYVLASLGFKGGLKGCETALGLDRGFLKGVDGYFAVLLWDDYQRTGSQKSLETLLAYNIEDTVNLETLMVMAYNLKLKSTPFETTHTLPLPDPPVLPYKPDLATVERIRSQVYSASYSNGW